MAFEAEGMCISEIVSKGENIPFGGFSFLSIWILWKQLVRVWDTILFWTSESTLPCQANTICCFVKLIHVELSYIWYKKYLFGSLTNWMPVLSNNLIILKHNILKVQFCFWCFNAITRQYASLWNFHSYVLEIVSLNLIL